MKSMVTEKKIKQLFYHFKINIYIYIFSVIIKGAKTGDLHLQQDDSNYPTVGTTGAKP